MAINAKTILRKVELEHYIKRDYLDRAFNRSGLCAYCSHRIGCGLSGSFGLIYDCEEYEASEESACGLTFSAIELCEAPEEYCGLCAQCQKRNYCTLKDISGGVWHCEEYI